MKPIVKFMIHQWNMKDMDWLGYKLQKGNIYTYHHIIKEEHGGKQTINNGAILTEVSHPYLHIIEYKDYELYTYLTNLLICINNQRYMPTKQQLLAINSILESFEREHCSDRTQKGKLLIKEEYTKRIIK